jgi:hypothetical protein
VDHAIKGGHVAGPEDKRRTGWTLAEQERYEQARDLVSAVIAEYSARIAGAPREEADSLQEEQLSYMRRRNRLAVHDDSEIERILSEYPGTLQRLRRPSE